MNESKRVSEWVSSISQVKYLVTEDSVCLSSLLLQVKFIKTLKCFQLTFFYKNLIRNGSIIRDVIRALGLEYRYVDRSFVLVHVTYLTIIN